MLEFEHTNPCLNLAVTEEELMAQFSRTLDKVMPEKLMRFLMEDEPGRKSRLVSWLGELFDAENQQNLIHRAGYGDALFNETNLKEKAINAAVVHVLAKVYEKVVDPEVPLDACVKQGQQQQTIEALGENTLICLHALGLC